MILIMGGAGYIGSHTLRHLLDCGYECAVADNLVYGHREAVDPRAAFEKADLLDKDSLRNVFQKFRPEAVVHFAAFAYGNIIVVFFLHGLLPRLGIHSVSQSVAHEVEAQNGNDYHNTGGQPHIEMVI